jgi:hypothetical protein
LGAAEMVITPLTTMNDPINMPTRRPYLSDAGPPKSEPAKLPAERFNFVAEAQMRVTNLWSIWQ